jgi:hypothetical protein
MSRGEGHFVKQSGFNGVQMTPSTATVPAFDPQKDEDLRLWSPFKGAIAPHREDRNVLEQEVREPEVPNS